MKRELPADEQRVNLSFRASFKLQERLRIEAAKRRTSVQQLLEEGLTLLLSAGKKATPNGHPKKRVDPKAELRRDLEALDRARRLMLSKGRNNK
jgi:hypothetical protein